MRSECLYEKIRQDLLREILNGRYPEGSFLPSEMALAERYGVSRITTRRALQELETSGYVSRRPGCGTKVLDPSKDRKLIGLSLSNFNALFGMNFIQGVINKAYEQGYFVLPQIGYYLHSQEELRLRELIRAGVKGVIMVPLYEADRSGSAIPELASTIPFVFADRAVSGVCIPLVCTDNAAATETLCRKLFEMGHRNIAFVSGKPDSTAVIERLRGYHRFCDSIQLSQERRRTFTEIRSTLPGMDRADVRKRDIRMLQRFLVKNETVTAIVAHTYRVGLLVQEAIRLQGGQIPQDYSVNCFDAPDGESGAEFFSHMRQNEYEIGVRAVELLLALIAGEQTPAVSYVEAEYVEGSSCGPVRWREEIP